MNTSPGVVVVRTGSANLASVLAAFDRLGTPARVSDSAGDVEAAGFVVLPGVGAFGPAMTRLTERGLDRALVERVRCRRPLLAICLGMQLLCEASDESPGVRGLALVPGRLNRFDLAQRVPQMGWNNIVPTESASLLQPGFAYFANSYRLGQIPAGWAGAWSDYGGAFVSALERGPILACQFHPELSGSFGLSLIRRWLLSANAAEGLAC